MKKLNIISKLKIFKNIILYMYYIILQIHIWPNEDAIINY